MRSLLESVQLGSLVLANRVFMAPLTRNRADADGVHSELAATYYAQRASAGLIITEATQISPMGKGYINTPGIIAVQDRTGLCFGLVKAKALKAGKRGLEIEVSLSVGQPVQITPAQE